MKILATLLAVCIVTGCAQVHPQSDSPKYVHVVVMWLKNPGDETDRRKIIDTARTFVGKIPGLVRVESGVVQASTRPVVDSTYDVGLVMIFESGEALANYPKHPVHQKAVAEVITPLVDHFKVYDFADSGSNEKR